MLGLTLNSEIAAFLQQLPEHAEYEMLIRTSAPYQDFLKDSSQTILLSIHYKLVFLAVKNEAARRQQRQLDLLRMSEDEFLYLIGYLKNAFSYICLLGLNEQYQAIFADHCYCYADILAYEENVLNKERRQAERETTEILTDLIERYFRTAANLNHPAAIIEYAKLLYLTAKGLHADPSNPHTVKFKEDYEPDLCPEKRLIEAKAYLLKLNQHPDREGNEAKRFIVHIDLLLATSNQPKEFLNNLCSDIFKENKVEMPNENVHSLASPTNQAILPIDNWLVIHKITDLSPSATTTIFPPPLLTLPAAPEILTADKQAQPANQQSSANISPFSDDNKENIPPHDQASVASCTNSLATNGSDDGDDAGLTCAENLIADKGKYAKIPLSANTNLLQKINGHLKFFIQPKKEPAGITKPPHQVSAIKLKK